MTTEQKIIRAKVGLLELAKQLGNVSQACKIMEEASSEIIADAADSMLTAGGRPQLAPKLDVAKPKAALGAWPWRRR